MIVILQQIQKNSNVPFVCPFPAGEYHIHDLKLGVLTFPALPIMPVKKSFKANVVMTNKKRGVNEIFIAEYQIFLKIVKN